MFRRCSRRSVWYYPLRLDAALYIEVVFNQIAPDYLEGLLLVLPGEHLSQEVIVSTQVLLQSDKARVLVFNARAYVFVV